MLTHTAPLTLDALNYLGLGCGDRKVPRVPDGTRHYAAVRALLAVGFVRWSEPSSGLASWLAVTPMGRAYYGAGR